MDAELKKALEIIKSKLSKEEQVKALFTDKDGDIDLRYLKLKGFNVLLTGLEAEFILNRHQKAKLINNKWQEAEHIYNKGQIITSPNPDDKWNCLTNEQKQELIKKL